jgi:quinone-modifying oxidoreductase subunit QmoC
LKKIHLKDGKEARAMGNDVVRVEPELSIIKELQEAGGDTLKKCYQCATCSTVCPLSSDEAPFPRKHMILAQWGLKEKLLNDPGIWLCHQCGDCNKYCPRDARPGDVLAALRMLVIKEAMPFKAIYSLYNNVWGIPVLIGIALCWILLATFATFGGVPDFFDVNSFPYGGPHYEILFLHLPARVLMVDVVFLPLAAIIIILMCNTLSRMWNAYLENFKVPQAYRYGMWKILRTYLVPAIKEIIKHERFVKCNVNNWRTTPHKMLIYAFIILAITTAVVFFMADVLGFHTPWSPLKHPVKLFGNVGGVLLIYGSIMMIAGRSKAVGEGVIKTSYADLFLLYLLLIIGLTGFGIEVVRSIPGIKNITSLFYLGHLVAVFILFLGVLYSKFAHLIFRTMAMVFDLYYKDVVKEMES